MKAQPKSEGKNSLHSSQKCAKVHLAQSWMLADDTFHVSISTRLNTYCAHRLPGDHGMRAQPSLTMSKATLKCPSEQI